MKPTRYSMFKNELQYVVDMMERNDPNGEWDAKHIADNPLDYIEILEQWREDCGYVQPAPLWIDMCIDYLYLFVK